MVPIVETLRSKYQNRRIVFPEGRESSIVHAAFLAAREGICRPLLVAEKDEVQKVCEELTIPAAGWYETVMTGAAEPEWVQLLEAQGIDPVVAEILLAEPLYYGAMMVRVGAADAMVAGYVAESGEVISAATMMIGLQDKVAQPSSYFLFEIPGYNGAEGNRLIYADAGLQIEPGIEELARIAVLTAGSAADLLDWEPRVAMLSFSTKGSGEHEKSRLVRAAAQRAKELAPRLNVDGEMQADAALNPAIAAKKIPSGSAVAGRANILIFPDLNAGNIAYKLTQQLTGATAYGPILQGFRRPVGDLSRGSSVADILGVIAITAVM